MDSTSHSTSPPSIPLHSIDVCHVCGAGLCGIRICGFSGDNPHGLVVCDECEAMWTVPDTTLPPQWRDPENPTCPICQEPLWGPTSRWANREDLQQLGWQTEVNPALTTHLDG